MAGASISGGPLLVASNGTVNIGAVSSAASPANYVVAGVGFTTAPSSNVIPVFSAFPPTVLPGGASSVVNFTGPATITVDQLAAAGAVNNCGHPHHVGRPFGPRDHNLNVAGLFTNTGQVTETNNLALNQLAGGLANLGTINRGGWPRSRPSPRLRGMCRARACSSCQPPALTSRSWQPISTSRARSRPAPRRSAPAMRSALPRLWTTTATPTSAERWGRRRWRLALYQRWRYYRRQCDPHPFRRHFRQRRKYSS